MLAEFVLIVSTFQTFQLKQRRSLLDEQITADYSRFGNKPPEKPLITLPVHLKAAACVLRRTA